MKHFTLALSILTIHSVNPMERIISSFTNLFIDSKEQPQTDVTATDLDFFEYLAEEIITKIIACCTPASKNAFIHTNQLLQRLASKENSTTILRCSPLVLYPEDQKYYAKKCLKKDDVKTLKNLYFNGADLNTVFESHQPTFLHMVARNNCKKIAKFLIEETDTDINATKPGDSSPLYAACQEGHFDVVTSLLNQKTIDTKFQFREGFTSLYVTSQRGHLAIAKLLLMHDPDLLNMACIHGSTALYIAAQEGRTDIIEFFLTFDNINVNSRFRRGFTPIYVASRNGHLQAVQLLMNDKRTIIDSVDEDGSTPLYVACQNGYDKIVELLIAQPDVNINRPFLGGYRPIYVAAQNGHWRVIKALLTHPKIRVNDAAPNGSNALYIASQNGYTEVVTLLLDHPGINANQKSTGFPPLYIAAFKGYADIVALFVAHDQDGTLVNATSPDNITPLCIACEHVDINVVKALLQSTKINLHATNDEGKTPLDIAIKFKHKEMIRLLILAGATQ